ncbi:hypothetical protein DPMN_010484 [Dreissena polymorpha]|uniref:Uncharacterized protein n=1 Tax=Dreissena polymorpha TaxID=45954 RepID=A0A9D4N385_DREPO|nr:hypothetical protein DPMN_010484 [Dreissena polymorpha]
MHPLILKHLKHKVIQRVMVCAKAPLTVPRIGVKNSEFKIKDAPEEGGGCLENWHGMPDFLQKRRLRS